MENDQGERILTSLPGRFYSGPRKRGSPLALMMEERDDFQLARHLCVSKRTSQELVNGWLFFNEFKRVSASQVKVDERFSIQQLGGHRGEDSYGLLELGPVCIGASGALLHSLIEPS